MHNFSSGAMLKIAFISQPEYFRSMYENDLDEIAVVKEFKYNFSMTEKCFENLVAYDADINVFFRGEYFPEPILRRLKGLKVNLSSEPFPNYYDSKICYTIDSFNRFKAFSAIKNKSFDYVFHYDKSSLKYMENNGLYLSGEFVLPVSTNVYKKLHLVKNWDLFFIGRSTEHREDYLTELKHLYHFLHICHGVWGRALVNYFNRSKIVLNIHAENEISWEPRVQLTLASGCFLISEKISSNDYLEPGKDYIEIASRVELNEAVEYYLVNDEEREVIAISGYLKAKKYFDSKKCFVKLFDGLLDKKFQKFTYDNTKIMSSSLMYISLFFRMLMGRR